MPEFDPNTGEPVPTSAHLEGAARLKRLLAAARATLADAGDDELDEEEE